MNSYVKVFLKGEPVRWYDFPLEGKTFHMFVMQARFEGFILGSHGYVVHDEIKAMMLIQTETPAQTLHGLAPVGQA